MTDTDPLAEALHREFCPAMLPFDHGEFAFAGRLCVNIAKFVRAYVTAIEARANGRVARAEEAARLARQNRDQWIREGGVRCLTPTRWPRRWPTSRGGASA